MYVRPSSGTAVYTHADAARGQRAGRICQRAGHTCRCYAGQFAGRFWSSGGAKFTETGDSLPRTSMNRRAKFDAASFIIRGDMRNRTNSQTELQTVNDISTP